jgi:hypothetical protein
MNIGPLDPLVVPSSLHHPSSLLEQAVRVRARARARGSSQELDTVSFMGVLRGADGGGGRG